MVRNILNSLVFLGFSLSLALMGSETLLRLWDRTSSGQSANIIKPEDIDLSFNADGFRDRDYTPDKPANVFRILVLGNSATFGVSVTSRQTYVKQLEEMLNMNSSGRTFEVMNAGVPSWNMPYQQKFLEVKGLEYNPDLVILGFTLNTAETHYIPPDDLFSAEEKYQGDPEVLHRTPREWAKPLLEHRNWARSASTFSSVFTQIQIWLSNHSSLYRYVRWRYDLTRQPFDSADYPGSLYHQEASVHWDVCRKALLSIGQTLKTRRTPVALVVFPMFFRLKPAPRSDQGYMWEDLHRLVADAGHETGMTVVDLLPVFRGWDPRDISVDPYHMNPLGHSMATEFLYSELMKNRLIP